MKISYTPTFKAQIAQQLLKETKTLSQLAAEHRIYPNVLQEWRTTALYPFQPAADGERQVAQLQ